MPRLPTAANFGERPNPRTTTPIVSLPGAGAAESAEEASALMGTGGGEVLAKIGLEVDAAWRRVQAKEDAIARAEAITAFEKAATEEFQRVLVEGNPHRPSSISGYSKFLTDAQGKAIGGHKGVPESLARLTVDLERRKNAFSSRMAAEGVKAHVDFWKNTLQPEISRRVAQAYENPSRLLELFRDFDGQLQSYGSDEDAMSPQQAAEFSRTFRTEAAKAAISMFADAGQYKEAETLLNLPGLDSILDPTAQGQLRQKVATAKQAAISSPLEVVADPTSTTGYRFRSRPQAMGAEAPAPRSLVTIGQEEETAFAKNLGSKDAERVIGLIDQGRKAQRTIPEIDRMTAAMERGKFTTGSFADSRVFLSRLGEFLGVPVPEIIGDAATADTLDSAANKLAIEAATELESRVTNMSLGFIKDSLPNLARTPEGNKIILEVMRRSVKRDVEIGDLANKYAKLGKMRPDEGRSFDEAVRDLNERDPIITPELRERIIAGSQVAPKSFRELFDTKPPEGAPARPGLTFSGQRGGFLHYRDPKTGKEYREPWPPSPKP